MEEGEFMSKLFIVSLDHDTDGNLFEILQVKLKHHIKDHMLRVEEHCVI